MPEFPRKKTEQLILAARVGAGIAANPVDYPSPEFDTTVLNQHLADSTVSIADRQAKEAAAKLALEVENGHVADAAEETKRLLRLAEAKYPNDAAKLQELGWDAHSEPKSMPPGQVRALHAVSQGAGTVHLDWKAPIKTAETGPVAVYIVQRQTRDENTHAPIEEFGQWQALSYETETVLLGQPRGVEIRYQVIASNLNGNAAPLISEIIVL